MSQSLKAIIPRCVVVHCSASANGEHYDIDLITKDHLKRGFNSAGYQIVIQPDGEVQRGRGLNEKGAHCIERNHDSTGICLIGLDKFTQKQFEVLRYQIDGLMMTYPMNKWDIYCHYQFKSAQDQGKTCPSIRVNELLAWYLLFDNRAISKYILETK